MGRLHKIPNIFPPGKSQNINFDWVDLASGTGYVNYDCVNIVDDTSLKKLLVESNYSTALKGIVGYDTNVAYSHETDTTISATFAKILDLDWDSSTLQLPRILRGKLFINFWGSFKKTGGSEEMYYVLRLRKWDGASETEVANIQGVTTDFANDVPFHNSISLDVPETNYVIGDQIRITLEVWGKISAANTLTAAIPADPAADASDDGTIAFGASETRMRVTVPFKVES